MKHDILTRSALRDASQIGHEAGAVVALRLARIGRGDDGARDEAALMVNEKVWAGFELNVALMTGKLGWDPATIGQRTLRHYRRLVRANLRRLSKD